MGSPNRRPEFSEPFEPQKRPELYEPAQVIEPKRSRRIPPFIPWSAGILAALLLIATLAVTVLLNNPDFHRYLRSTLEKQASESLGVKVQLQEFALHFSTLSVDLYGVTIH